MLLCVHTPHPRINANDELIFIYILSCSGVTFLIAYLTMLLISGLPLFFLELSLGQYAGKGPLKVFGRMAPVAKGLGYGMLMITFLVVIYYNLIIAWTIYYTFAGFTSQLPWTDCGTSGLTSQNCFSVRFHYLF